MVDIHIVQVRRELFGLKNNQKIWLKYGNGSAELQMTSPLQVYDCPSLANFEGEYVFVIGGRIRNE